MHKTITAGRNAIDKTMRLMTDVSLELDSIYDGGCVTEECTNELTRLCLDRHKRIVMHLLDPYADKKRVREICKYLRSFGIHTAITKHTKEHRALILATTRADLNLWVKYKLGVRDSVARKYPFLVGWMLGYPINSIRNYWELDGLKNLNGLLERDFKIYKDELGCVPLRSAGFNWKYDLDDFIEFKHDDWTEIRPA